MKMLQIVWSPVNRRQKRFFSCPLEASSARQLWIPLQLNCRKASPVKESSFLPVEATTHPPPDPLPSRWSGFGLRGLRTRCGARPLATERYGIRMEDLIGGAEDEFEMGVLGLVSEVMRGT